MSEAALSVSGLTRDFGPFRIGQNGCRAHAQRKGDEFSAMHARAGHRRKQKAVLHIATVHGHAGNNRIRSAAGRKAIGGIGRS